MSTNLAGLLSDEYIEHSLGIARRCLEEGNIVGADKVRQELIGYFSKVGSHDSKLYAAFLGEINWRGISDVSSFESYYLDLTN